MVDDEDAFLSEAERAFLHALNVRGVRFLLVGMSAALLQGARGATEDIDLWFEDIEDECLAEAAHEAGGFLVTRSQPPILGGALGDRFDIVTSMSGLLDFDAEYRAAKTEVLEGEQVRILPLARILHSKKAADRPKDRAVIHALETALKLIRQLDKGE